MKVKVNGFSVVEYFQSYFVRQNTDYFDTNHFYNQHSPNLTYAHSSVANEVIQIFLPESLQILLFPKPF